MELELASAIGCNGLLHAILIIAGDALARLLFCRNGSSQRANRLSIIGRIIRIVCIRKFATHRSSSRKRRIRHILHLLIVDIPHVSTSAGRKHSDLIRRLPQHRQRSARLCSAVHHRARSHILRQLRQELRRSHRALIRSHQLLRTAHGHHKRRKCNKNPSQVNIHRLSFKLHTSRSTSVRDLRLVQYLIISIFQRLERVWSYVGRGSLCAELLCRCTTTCCNVITTTVQVELTVHFDDILNQIGIAETIVHQHNTYR